MPETTPNSKGPAPAKLPTAAPEPTLIPADQVKPEDIGTLSLHYVDGQPRLVVSGGKVIPAGLMVVNESGEAVAAYTAGSAPTATKERNATLSGLDVNYPYFFWSGAQLVGDLGYEYK